MTTTVQDIAIITGAGSGVGRSVAYSLAQRGVHVVLIDRDEPMVRETVDVIASEGGKADLHVADMASRDSVDTLLKALLEQYSSVMMLVHSAGFINLANLQDADINDLDLHYRVNVWAPYYITQKLLPNIISCQGQIVFMNSSMGVGTKMGASQYAATKHALRAMADTLRLEVNEQGVRVTSVFPGKIATPMQQKIAISSGIPYNPTAMLQVEDVSSTIVHALYLPRSAEITDIHIRPMNKSL